MNSGKYVFAQLLQFINEYEFEKCVIRFKGDYRVRELNCWNQFVQLFLVSLLHATPFGIGGFTLTLASIS